ncbi:MAG: carbamate kinase [Dermatophilaceae bacterium]
MRVVLALGGNAMTGPDGSATPAAQVAALGDAAREAAQVVAAGHELLVTHGNGPQVGNLLVKNELAAHVVPPVPLDWCGAQTQGTIGAALLNALEGALAEVSPGVSRAHAKGGTRAWAAAPPVAALVTRTLVAADDPGLTRPTKPIGRYVSRDEAARMTAHGQVWDHRGERGWRRVVASPEPLEVLDLATARTLLDAGYVVVAAGGGGIPVVRRPDGHLHGVEAVVDKDLTAALLAGRIGAEVLVIATDVDRVSTGFGTTHQRDLGRVTVGELRAHCAAGEFASGSMAPKVEAAIRFVEGGGRRAVVTSLARIADGVDGHAGTVVEPTSSAADPTSSAHD